VAGIFSSCLIRCGTWGKESDLERMAKALIIKGVLVLRGRVESPIDNSFRLPCCMLFRCGPRSEFGLGLR
jgi:hypothetical protein